MYFCFRWLLIRFKRELSFMDVLRLWEVSSPAARTSCESVVSRPSLCLTPRPSRPQVMWTDLPCQNFHLLVCCAILDSEKQKIMEESYGFNEILKVRPCDTIISEHSGPLYRVGMLMLPPAGSETCC